MPSTPVSNTANALRPASTLYHLDYQASSNAHAAIRSLTRGPLHSRSPHRQSQHFHLIFCLCVGGKRPDLILSPKSRSAVAALVSLSTQSGVPDIWTDFEKLRNRHVSAGTRAAPLR
ncbi:hypothetical protein K458DRAFT_412095 [Lentithecium fluviatile CBS 122367]|uniref:Uncharacterized protein n=1 Tax=Lentithecium fluviatile CBS 122367 TaxID=1168545 RepID=A0A6G1JJM0_9PLEO|nr:hypothetical protein K458DRAFT_412095 [Lentithecium fluviatile CBS 122367]